jgi:hypothetical protein
MSPTELLQPFCSTDGLRANLIRPFVQHGHLIGTDGRIFIAIRDALGEPPITLPGGKTVETDNVLLGIETALTQPPAVFPTELPPLLTQPCKHCAGDGKFQKCRECDGTGEVECGECGQCHQCGDCKGAGKHPDLNGTEECEFCEGTGKTAMLVRVRIGLCDYNNRYLRLIREHLNVTTFHPNGRHITAFTGTFRAAPHITYLGGIMPMNAPTPPPNHP